ncbi:MAG: T9SS type A sorting domain-containing protein [Saprospiraceae bacterium]|nr:T9SS type A sorting domain-containing protein [Saprospiraceae bacterium]
MTGKRIYSENLQIPNLVSETIIDISKFSEGVYILQIQYQNFIEMKKFIVTK